MANHISSATRRVKHASAGQQGAPASRPSGSQKTSGPSGVKRGPIFRRVVRRAAARRAVQRATLRRTMRFFFFLCVLGRIAPGEQPLA